MVRHVINSYLEYDEDDEGAPTLLGFAIRGIVVSVILAVAVTLLFRGVYAMVAGAGLTEDQQLADVRLSWLVLLLDRVELGFYEASCAVVGSFVMSPLYLLSLRNRENAGKDTSGAVMRALAMCVALVLFAVSALLLHGWMW